MDTKRRKITHAKSSSVVIANNIKILKFPSDKTPGPNSHVQETDRRSDSGSGQAANTNNSNKSSSISYRLVPLSNSTPNSSSISSPSSTSGQVLVMMPNNRGEVHNQNVFIKRTEDPFTKTVIDQKRRMMHKEIERRRRDKINDWIFVLSKQVPDCASDRTKQGQSKGGILAKTAKYIQELRSENDKLNDVIKEKDELNKELERLRQQLISVEAENKNLHTLLQENNIPIIKNETR